MNGEWKTINGARVFIEDGQSLEEALANRDKANKLLGISESKKPVSKEDISFLRSLITDNKPHVESPRWKFDDNNKSAFKDIGSYKEDIFTELKNEEDGTITKWLKDHGFEYELSKGDYEWETKGSTGRNWVNTDKGNKKTATNRIILKVNWK